MRAQADATQQWGEVWTDGAGDIALATAWAGGDVRAGERLVARHREAIARFFSNRVGAGAEDLVQETFLACSASVARFEGRASFRGYLFGIARNVLQRHYRGRARDVDLRSRPSPAEAAPGPTPAEVVAWAQEQRALFRALRTLPGDLQALVELAYWEGLSDREVAEVYEVPKGTIKSRLRKARRELGRLLDDSAVPSVAACAAVP